MSLTSELERTSSWVNQFFKEYFSRVTEFTRVEGPAIRAFETKVPTELRGHATARVGTALDYRVRLALGQRPLDSRVINGGIYRMALWAQPDLEMSAVINWVMGVMRSLGDGGEQSAEELAKTAVLMAHLDAGFRSRGQWSEDMRLLALIKAAAPVENEDTVERGWTRESSILEVAEPEEVNEVMRLMAVARTSFDWEHAGNVVIGPIFAGSRYVGGADADLILSGLLLDIKTTEEPRKDFPNTIRQLIGYALLDWDDEYGINGAGVYFSRQGKTVSWAMDDLIRRTATGTEVSLGEMRIKFKRLAVENDPRAVIQSRRGG